MSTVECPGRLALCGTPCGCAGKNRSHYPLVALGPSLTSTTDESTDADQATDLDAARQRIADYFTGYIAGINLALELIDDE